MSVRTRGYDMTKNVRWQKLRIDSGWETAVESVLRERLHALELADPAPLETLGSDQPPVKASLFAQGSGAVPQALSGYPSLASKVHATDAAVSGALADWFSGFYAAEVDPDRAARAGLPAGAVLVNRAGHQFTGHTLSFHAPDPSDAGLLARQGEIEVCHGASPVK